VNRAPIAGTIASVQYREGRFHVASRAACSNENEQNVVTVQGDGSVDGSVNGSVNGSTDRPVNGTTDGSVNGTMDGSVVVFKQIAGLIARRIVFRKRPGDRVSAGERVGLIKFGSRVDVLFGPEWEIAVRPGERVSAGSSVIARRVDRGAPDGA
jgi:phosphatidylserine decarboxylase